MTRLCIFLGFQFFVKNEENDYFLHEERLIVEGKNEAKMSLILNRLFQEFFLKSKKWEEDIMTWQILKYFHLNTSPSQLFSNHLIRKTWKFFGFLLHFRLLNSSISSSISAYPIQTHFFAKKWVSFFDPNMDSIIGSKNEGLFLIPHFLDPNMDLILQIMSWKLVNYLNFSCYL